MRCDTPKSWHSLNCVIVATVSPHDPWLNWRANNCGHIVVLACGASWMPTRSMYACISPRLLSSAERFSTATGTGKSPRSRFNPRPATSATRPIEPSSGRPLVPAGKASASISVRRKVVSSSAPRLQGDDFDFDLGVDHQRGLHARARRQGLREIARVHAVEGLEVAGVVEPYVHLDDILQRAAGLLEDGANA